MIQQIRRMIRQAHEEHRVLRIQYTAEGKELPRTRDIHVYVYGPWYIGARCMLRNDFRSFRIDRIQEAELLEARFEPNEYFVGKFASSDFKTRVPKDLPEAMRALLPEVPSPQPQPPGEETPEGGWWRWILKVAASVLVGVAALLVFRVCEWVPCDFCSGIRWLTLGEIYGRGNSSEVAWSCLRCKARGGITPACYLFESPPSDRLFAGQAKVPEVEVERVKALRRRRGG
jgi:hypothetical protein